MQIDAGSQFVPLDEQAAISVGKDYLSAYLTFSPPKGGRLLTYGELVKLLNDKKVIFGIDNDKLQSLSGTMKKQYNAPILVASGIAPVNGTDAKVDFNFSIARDRTPKLLPDGTVDHRALNYVESVHKGDVLARMTKETPGTSGINVFGAEVKPKQGRPRVLPKGRNTEITPDKLSLVASADGNVEIIDGKITISSLLEIKGDVGAATGHVIFAGDVKISGNVISTYNVMAEGSVFVGGVIESSEIRAGQDITIAHGVKGLASRGSECIIYAGGNITSKFIENATVFANGTIRTDSIIHSKVSSYDTIIVWGRTGNIIGGKVRALREIVCDTVGAAGRLTAAKTVLESGFTDSITENYSSLKAEVERLEADIDRYKKTIKELEHVPNPSSAQSKRMYASNKSLKEAELTYQDKLTELALLDSVFDTHWPGKITVNKTMYPPVIMTIDKQTRTFEENSSASAYRVVDMEIKSVPI